VKTLLDNRLSLTNQVFGSHTKSSLQTAISIHTSCYEFVLKAPCFSVYKVCKLNKGKKSVMKLDTVNSPEHTDKERYVIELDHESHLDNVF